ncbi:MAG: hypothetical protein KR126chlam1_00300 [Chlamydiae bacterium]|nr:hypothetical protein [Chlamydiota bacterium]
MWARVVEFMIAVWLAISPFIFGYPDQSFFYWTNDLICSSLIAFFALISFYTRLRKMHLCQLFVSLWLFSVSFYLRTTGLQAPLQNYVVIAFLLLMIAIVPTDATQPPKPWRDFYKRDL